MNIRQSHFYTEINELLRQRLPIILSLIKQTLLSQNDPNKNQLEVCCILERHLWGQDTQWRIEVDFENYENGYAEETSRPHSIGGFVMLEEVRGKQILYCQYGRFYNSFKNDKTEIKDDTTMFDEQIAYTELENKSLTTERLDRINLFLDSLHKRLIDGIDSINFKELGNIILGNSGAELQTFSFSNSNRLR